MFSFHNLILSQHNYNGFCLVHGKFTSETSRPISLQVWMYCSVAYIQNNVAIKNEHSMQT